MKNATAVYSPTKYSMFHFIVTGLQQLKEENTRETLS